MSIDIVRAEDALQHLITEAAKAEQLRAENRHLREIIARMPKPRTIYSRRVDAPIAACPFCGGTSTVYESGLRDGCLDGEPDAWTSAVTCCSCAAVGPWRKADTREDAEKRALTAWSSRLAGDFRRFYDEINDAADQFHRDIGAEPGSVAPHVVIANASGYYLDREHLRTVERELRDMLSIDNDADIVDAVREMILWRDNLKMGADRVCDALYHQAALSARDHWHLDAARVIRERGELQATVLAQQEEIRKLILHRDELQARAQRTADLAAIHEAMSESPIPQPPPDCDLAGWIRYKMAVWRSEREEARHLADLCQGAHDTLTALGAMPEGTPAERIRAFYAAVHAAFSAQLHEANDARTRLADNADWVIRALAHANKLRAKDTWHQDAAGVIREFSAVLSRLTDVENEIDDCCRILHVSGDRDLRAVVTDLMRELEERRCAVIRTERPTDTEGAGWQHIVYRPEELSGWTADPETSAQGEPPATLDEKP